MLSFIVFGAVAGVNRAAFAAGDGPSDAVAAIYKAAAGPARREGEKRTREGGKEERGRERERNVIEFGFRLVCHLMSG